MHERALLIDDGPAPFSTHSWMVANSRLAMAATVKIAAGPPGLASLGKVIGPAYLVAVGYMDPGSLATDLAATPGSWPKWP
jgi:hypothetical protein